jgi:hypothetical protein
MDSAFGMFREIVVNATGGFLASFLFLIVSRRMGRQPAPPPPPETGVSGRRTEIQNPFEGEVTFLKATAARRPRTFGSVVSSVFHFLLGIVFTLPVTFAYVFVEIGVASDAAQAQKHAPGAVEGYVVVPVLFLMFLSSVRAQNLGKFWSFWLRFTLVSAGLLFLFMIGVFLAYGAPENGQPMHGLPDETTVALQLSAIIVLVELVAIAYSMPSPPRWVLGRGGE